MLPFFKFSSLKNFSTCCLQNVRTWRIPVSVLTRPRHRAIQRWTLWSRKNTIAQWPLIIRQLFLERIPWKLRQWNWLVWTTPNKVDFKFTVADWAVIVQHTVFGPTKLCIIVTLQVATAGQLPNEDLLWLFFLKSSLCKHSRNQNQSRSNSIIFLKQAEYRSHCHWYFMNVPLNLSWTAAYITVCFHCSFPFLVLETSLPIRNRKKHTLIFNALTWQGARTVWEKSG